MARPHGITPDGRPANLIGQPLDLVPAPPPAVIVAPREVLAMAKQIADRDGVYVLNGNRFRIRKGAPLPAGAEMEGAKKETSKRAEKAAPETRKLDGAPENRSA